MQEQIARGDVLLRIAGVAFIAGGVVTAGAAAAHPLPEDVSDTAALVNVVAETPRFAYRAVHLSLAAGVVLLTIGASGVSRSISAGAAAAWARTGFYAIAIGAVVWVVGISVDGLVLSAVADDWERAAVGPEKDTLLSIAVSMSAIEEALSTISAILSWSGAIALGAGVLLSGIYPAWLGWPLIVLGALFALLGLIAAFVGLNQQAFLLPLVALSALAVAWALIMGGWRTRKVW